ncbi:type II secretion system protein [Desulfotignum balticum]|jgi:prepilin-type N-terminal cleavage/methylation domain-containing protein|uniref:type II secretion system protein n=1 Tax=Desulfotignum balticum TaxID=115781 RepID=UPI00041F2855|nr:prepilin-type N-terminal cleavage/methylation domain-containing protein [Desulfotignum balticum]
MNTDQPTNSVKKPIQNSSGFSLLEILVVLTVMGFLIAMVAPRLGGISSSAVDTVCDSNQNRMVTMMSTFFEQTNRFPSKLTNLVEETADNTYQIPAVSDDNPENGPETLASEFMERNHFRIHYLDDDEAAELKNMGITRVLNLNAYDAYNEDGSGFKDDYDESINNDVTLATTVTKAPTLEEITVPTDTGTTPFAVAMVGIGHNDTDWDLHEDEKNWGEPDWFGRIVLGFGPENSLVTGGIVANAAHCPGGIQNADNVTYNDYNLVLPRLEATADRFEADIASLGFGATAIDGLEELQAVAYDDEPADGYVIADNDDNLKVRTFDIASAQERWQYATQCPEGHMFPADDEEFWGIDIDDDGTIGTVVTP